MSKVEEACQLAKKSFEEAQVFFKNSVNNMPSPWTIFGVNVLEGLVGVVGTFCSYYQMGYSKMSRAVIRKCCQYYHFHRNTSCFGFSRASQEGNW